MKTWLMIALICVSAAGCKQGVGQRCQLNDDCTSGNCAGPVGNKVCVDVTPVDAEIVTTPIDATVIDSQPLDAPADAT